MIDYPKNKKSNNPNKDVTIIYESGGRDIEHPFSSDALDALEEESEGSWEIDLRNACRNDVGGYPAEDEDSKWGYLKDEQVYPHYYSKKGAPRGEGYPIEKDWWQKALSFISEVKSKYKIKIGEHS